MCGRYTQKQKAAIIAKMHGVDKVVAEISASFNVCPGQDVGAIAGHAERRLGLLRWGLPALREGGRPLINAIITTSANSLIAPIHDRMPVILPPASIDAWLDLKYKDAVRLLQPYPAEAMAWHPVSDAVNSPRNDGPELVQPWVDQNNTGRAHP